MAQPACLLNQDWVLLFTYGWGFVNPYHVENLRNVNFYETIFNSELVLCRIWLEEK